METWIQTLITIVGAVLASSGFWTILQRKMEKHDVKTKMLIGLAHDRIIFLSMKYIERGWITNDEYENLHDYLYAPYRQMGGNGSANRVMEELKRVPIRRGYFTKKGGEIDVI